MATTAVRRSAMSRERDDFLDGVRLTALSIASAEGVSFDHAGLVALLEIFATAPLAESIGEAEMLQCLGAVVQVVHQAALEAHRVGSKTVTAGIVESLRRLLCPLPPWFNPPC